MPSACIKRCPILAHRPRFGKPMGAIETVTT